MTTDDKKLPRPSDIAFTPAVKAEQEKRGSREGYRRMEETRGWPTTVTPDLVQFLADVRSFYLATASADGQPYVQHRGGPAGFLRVIDDHTLGFADFGGNKQYITAGNLAENPRAFLFLMDYQRRRRVKIWGTARIVEGDAALIEQLRDPRYPAAPERAVVFAIEAWDRNCPQHIPQLLPAEEVADVVGALRARVAELEEKLRLARC